jgi:hypothetical protein
VSRTALKLVAIVPKPETTDTILAHAAPELEGAKTSSILKAARPIVRITNPLERESLASLRRRTQDSGAVGRYLAIWNVAAARDLAWDVANALRPLEGGARGAGSTSSFVRSGLPLNN